MADRAPAPDTPELRERWGGFVWTDENAEKARTFVSRYPEGRQKSAVMPLLDLAQRQVGERGRQVLQSPGLTTSQRSRNGDMAQT